MWLIIGVVLGSLLGAAGGIWAFARTPLDNLLAASTSSAETLIRGAVEFLHLPAHEPLFVILSALGGVMAPGLVCLAVAEAIRFGKDVKRAAVTVLIGLSLIGFFMNPSPGMFALALLAVAVSLLLTFARGPFLTFPAATVIAAITARTAVAVIDGGAMFSPAAHTIAAALGGTPGLWTLVLGLAALAPAAGAAGLLLRSR